MQGRVGETFDGIQVELAEQLHVGLGVRQPGLLQVLQHITARRVGEAPVERAAFQLEGVAVAVVVMAVAVARPRQLVQSSFCYFQRLKKLQTT